jgi:lantibiotic modifying enzyme
MGMLLAVCHCLAITDIHCENLIAAGEHPLIVDLESIFSEGYERSEQPILTTGLLPRWQESPDGERFDMSALAADAVRTSGVESPVWKHVNTDQLTMLKESRTVSSASHRVRLGADLPSVYPRLNLFLLGFEETYRCINSHRRSLLANEGLLSRFDKLDLRILVRDTRTYSRLQLHTLHPKYLKDGLDRSIELEWLARPLSGRETPQKDRAWLYEYERAAMEHLDVPYFSTSTWHELRHDAVDPDVRSLRGYRDLRVLRSRLDEMSRVDIVRQRAIVEDAISSRFSQA